MIMRKPIDTKKSPTDQKAQAIKTIVRAFFIQNIKISVKEYSTVEKEGLQQEDRDNSEIIKVRFKTINDISKVNSKLVNLNQNNRNKIYQFVPNPQK